MYVVCHREIYVRITLCIIIYAAKPLHGVSIMQFNDTRTGAAPFFFLFRLQCASKRNVHARTRFRLRDAVRSSAGRIVKSPGPS